MIPIITPQDSYVIGPNGEEFRNLTAQVQKNKEDIARHYAIDRVLANFGIKVVGMAQSAEELPDPATYQGNYGDAYAVGPYAPYSFYIFTRPDANTGGNEPFWLDAGGIGIQGEPGPIGPQGKTGAQGVRGNNMTTGTTVPDPSSPSLINGDVFLSMPSGMIYRFKDSPDGKGWESVGSIKGPKGERGATGPQGEPGRQGEKGEKGDRGDVGGFINIHGVLANISQLPTPESLQNLTIAYLVGAASPYDLYVQVGSTSSEAMWTNTGPFNAATAVSVNGNFQNIWDADTKQDKLVNNTDYKVVPVITQNSSDVNNFALTHGAISWSVTQRTERGGLRANFDKDFTGMTTDEEKNQQVVNYGYLNETLNTKVSKYTGSTGLVRVYGVDTRNNEKSFIVGTSDIAFHPGYVPYVRDKDSGTTQPNGYLITHNPVNPYQAANKDYVDTQIAGLGGKTYRHLITVTRGYNGETVLENYGFVNFVVYSSNATPIDTYDKLSSLNTQLGGSITANLCWGYSELYLTDSPDGLVLPYRVSLGSAAITLDYIAAHPTTGNQAGSVSWSDFNNITITDNVTEV